MAAQSRYFDFWLDGVFGMTVEEFKKRYEFTDDYLIDQWNRDRSVPAWIGKMLHEGKMLDMMLGKR